jgi:hypothetical protein
MNANVIHLPRPRDVRPQEEGLGLFVRVARNDHKEILDLIATGERGIFGFVIEAQHVKRHADLIAEAQKSGFDLILDPKTQAMGFPGGHTDSLATLPWGLTRHHRLTDFDGTAGRHRAVQMVEVARESGFTQLLGPTHLLSGPNDPWLRRDIATMRWAYEEIARGGGGIELIYSLALPIDVLRREGERNAMISAIAEAPCDAIWLKIENFGDDASGEKTAAYIAACRDFHTRGVPVIGDHLGGLPGLGALAFGAVGAIAHGVTMLQSFKAAGWRRPQIPGNGGRPRRVYIPQLDMLLKRDAAKALLDSSPRVRALCGCRDTHCCPQGPRDMIGRPARHALYQRAREVEGLGATPESLRVPQYLDERVRRVSDDVAAIAALANRIEPLRESLLKKQAEIGRFRQVMVHLAGVARPESSALVPRRRVPRRERGDRAS